MDLVFCTLFDSNYLDKGLVLYHSMERCMDDFKLYVIAFDSTCEQVLRSENLDKMIVVGLEEFETEDLLNVKKERSNAEYSWTCSSWSIRYVIEHFNEPICTYIDADMMFFSNPQCIFDDMRKNSCSTIIVPHNIKDEEEIPKKVRPVGSYCVEFNTFINDVNGREALDWWSDRCLEWCFYAPPGTTEWYGDQKYLDVFSEKFKGVYICKHYGLGLAPWNNYLVDYAGERDDIPLIRVKENGQVLPLILYHFEKVGFITPHILHASSRMQSKELHRAIYDKYVPLIIEQRKIIESKYNLRLTKKHRVLTNNFALKIYQKYISPFKHVKKISDLYWVK